MTEPVQPMTESAAADLGSPTLGERITDVFVAPGRAMLATANRPAWWLPALISCLVILLFTMVNVQQITTVQREAQLEEASSDQAAMLEKQLELFEDPPVWLRALSGLGAAVGVLVGGLIFAMVCTCS